MRRKINIIEVDSRLLPLQSGEIFVEKLLILKIKKRSIKLSYVSQKANAFNSGFPSKC